MQTVLLIGLVILPMVLALLLTTWKGAKPERYASFALIGAVLLDLAYHALLGTAHYQRVDIGHFAIDTVCFSAFLAIALYANRVWPLWCCAIQLIGVSAHLAAILRLDGNRNVYWLMTALPAQATLVFLALGTLAHINRRARIGPYRDWRIA